MQAASQAIHIARRCNFHPLLANGAWQFAPRPCIFAANGKYCLVIMTTYALIVAAGRGQRLAGDVPKQYRRLGACALLTHTVQCFLNCDGIDGVCVVIHPDDRSLYEAAVRGLGLLPPVTGGATRQLSVRHGLEALATIDPTARVLVHDAARPFVPRSMILRVLAALESHAAVLPALALADTLKRGRDGAVTGTVPREGLYRAQTPQGFHLGPLLAAHRRLTGTEATDDAAIMELAGERVHLVTGDERAFKVTTNADLVQAEAMLARETETRVGSGFDVHRFGKGEGVMLCGVPVPHSRGLVGHSDADVGLHALVDALLGAIGEGDIGQHFPPGDPQWKGAPSSRFLENAAERVAARGGCIRHVDITIICEAPKVGPHREAMIDTIAGLLKIDRSRVSVKATTTEKLGFTGRGEGIAAQAVATVALPADRLSGLEDAPA
jgi:2-C-methyl-D-erythritol 4-phosphate cytidylyltransferase/2-C-methyl-D-erythritol 2,4-cyclodiphosphate synthase